MLKKAAKLCFSFFYPLLSHFAERIFRAGEKPLRRMMPEALAVVRTRMAKYRRKVFSPFSSSAKITVRAAGWLDGRAEPGSLVV
jgi:hypothetical protein